MIGDRVVVVTLALYMTQRTGSATDLGIVLAAQSLPLVGLLLFGGVWADRLPRHQIMVATDVARAALHALAAVLVLTGAMTIWELAVIEALFGSAQAFFQPAYSGLVPQTVPEDEIQDARALTESVANLAFLVGPALGTAIVLGIGAGEAFALDCRDVRRQRGAPAPGRAAPNGANRPRPRRCSRGSSAAGARSARGRGCGSRSWSSPGR